MSQKKIYFENLDGLRFMCFLMVFLFHSFSTEFDYIKNSNLYGFINNDIFGNGNLGVNFFFVLSGFLITYLLIVEKRLNGQISARKFWIRRMLRIWPLFYLCVIFGFYIFPLLKSFFGQVPNESASIGYYLAFLNNFDFIKHGLPDASILGVLWSVAIEEQFYFIWPVILLLLPVKRYWIAFVAVIIGSLIFRAYFDSPLLNEHHTLSCIGDMAIGAFGAWLVLVNEQLKERIINMNRWAIAFVYILFLCCFFFRDDLLYTTYLLRVFERMFIAVIILFIILEQTFSKNSLYKMSRYKRISALGRISYGLYCLHFIGILITTTITAQLGLNTHFWQVMVLETFGALSITILISFISYRFYEKPFLRVKNRFAYITR